jgi:hypothetical protein
MAAMMQPGRKKEKPGARHMAAIRFRPQGAAVSTVDHEIVAVSDPLSANHEMSNRGIIDVEVDTHGTVVTASNTIPRP